MSPGFQPCPSLAGTVSAHDRGRVFLSFRRLRPAPRFSFMNSAVFAISTIDRANGDFRYNASLPGPPRGRRITLLETQLDEDSCRLTLEEPTSNSRLRTRLKTAQISLRQGN